MRLGAEPFLDRMGDGLSEFVYNITSPLSSPTRLYDQ